MFTLIILYKYLLSHWEKLSSVAGAGIVAGTTDSSDALDRVRRIFQPPRRSLKLAPSMTTMGPFFAPLARQVR
jgi:hypothetical protein